MSFLTSTIVSNINTEFAESTYYTAIKLFNSFTKLINIGFTSHSIFLTHHYFFVVMKQLFIDLK